MEKRNTNDLNFDKTQSKLLSVINKIERIKFEPLLELIIADIDSTYKAQNESYEDLGSHVRSSVIEDFKKKLNPHVGKFNRVLDSLTDNSLQNLLINTNKVSNGLYSLRDCILKIINICPQDESLSLRFNLIDIAIEIFSSLNKDELIKTIPILNQQISRFEEELVTINSKYTQLSKNMNDLSLSIDNKLEETRGIVISELKNSIASFRNNNKLESETIINNLNSALDDIVSQYKAEFQLIHDNFQGQIDSSSDSMTQQVKKMEISVLKSEHELTSSKKLLHDSIKEEVKGFANQKNKLVKLVGSLSALSKSKEDLNRAEIEANKADSFRLYGIILMILPLVMFLVLFLKQSDSGFELNFAHDAFGMISKFFSIVLFSSPFIYLLKESAYHRRVELKYRTRGIQLASFDGFIDDLDPESKKKIKDNLATHFFGNDEVEVNTSNIPNVLQEIKELLASIKVK